MISELDKKIGSKIERILIGRGLKYKPFANKNQLDPALFYRLRKGKQRWNTSYLEKVSSGLNLPIAGFFEEFPLSPTQPAELEGDYYKIPLVSGKIAAGPGRMIPENEISSYVWIHSNKLIGRRFHQIIGVEVGENEISMSATILPNDIILIDRDDPQGKSEFQSGHIYGVRTKGGECQVKRVYAKDHMLIIGSDNHKYPPEPAWTDDLKRLLIGRVVWGWRDLQEL